MLRQSHPPSDFISALQTKEKTRFRFCRVRCQGFRQIGCLIHKRLRNLLNSRATKSAARLCSGFRRLAALVIFLCHCRFRRCAVPLRNPPPRSQPSDTRRSCRRAFRTHDFERCLCPALVPGCSPRPLCELSPLLPIGNVEEIMNAEDGRSPARSGQGEAAAWGRGELKKTG